MVVFLSDGDNNDWISQADYIAGYPPSPCMPPWVTTDWRTWNICVDSVAQERQLDRLTWRLAEDLKSQGAEIYVVGFDVCGTDDGKTRDSPGYCAGIDNVATPIHDNDADQRLLKCIASSPDHFFRAPAAVDLPNVYEDIAQELPEVDWESAPRGIFE